VDGAKAGIVMKAAPQIGDSYRLEYYAGEAEDMADVLSLNESVTVPHGSFTGCLKTYDYTPLDPAAQEHKYYCKDVGFVVLELNLEDNERTELVSVTRGDSAAPSPGPAVRPSSPPTPSPAPTSATPPTPPPAASGEITEAQAKAIALARVSGTVTDVAIETKFGKKTYVVEIQPSYGAETDVVIDIQTGEVLAVEN
jgi:uncharacterized membrane protein YkoI